MSEKGFSLGNGGKGDEERWRQGVMARIRRLGLSVIAIAMVDVRN